MATAASRRRAKKPEPLAKGTGYRGVGHGRAALFPPVAHAAIALTKTQRHAERASEPTTLYVERQTLFGPAVDLYAVSRDEAGTVSTRILTPED